MLRAFTAAIAIILFAGSAHAAVLGPAPPPEYRLQVSFDIPRSRVTGTLTFAVTAGRSFRFRTGTLTMTGAVLNGKDLNATVSGGTVSFTPGRDGVAELRYEGVFRGGEAQGERNYGVVSDTIDERGISLTGTWYPEPEGLARWRLSALLPAGYEAISEAEKITRVPKQGGTEFTFDFPHPVDGVTLVATDRYEVTSERSGGIELYAYFFREDRGLAKDYLDAAKRYFELYGNMLTPYPYKRFTIVENFLPTGYSLPTFTLLGQDVVRLPFIIRTSLGHEILHQWFGNSVYGDPAAGNWMEGLTTYLADQWYEEQKGAGWEYRKQLLVDYAAYVHGKNDLPLREFRGRTDPASRAIGYGKSAMVFHMLRKMTGDTVFFEALRDFIDLRQFREATWDDIRTVFEKRSGRDLAAFFRQWLDGTGLPQVEVEDASLRRDADRFEISIDLSRKGISLPLDLPVEVQFLRGGKKREQVTLDADQKTVTLFVDREPGTVVLDPDYDVARMPTDDELPPVIARVIGDEKPLIVLPQGAKDRYAAVIAEFAKKGGDQREADAVKDGEIAGSSLVILGKDNPLIDRLFGTVEVPAGGFSVTVRKNPWNRAKVAGIFNAASVDEVADAFGKVFHYGKYSVLAFDRGKNIEKRIEPGERGIIMELREEAPVVDLSRLLTVPDVVEQAAAKRIVYVGEYHDRFSHHNIELQVIRDLYRRNAKLAIGMEMFQRPFQKVLDDYIAGAIDEREFLVQSEYFKRWGFDYNLYKPILDFARQEKIPVVALNLKREITEKVAKSGMDSLTAEERRELPRETDFSDEDYRDRIRQAFEQHPDPEKRNFDFFLQAQVLWDETMAESITDYLAANPDRQLVVLAGGGHLVYGTGIPLRSFRRNGLSYTIILNDADIDRTVGNFVVLPQRLDGLTAPKLMAMFSEEQGRLVFSDFVKDSPARAAGLRRGDELTALDGKAVSGIGDVKLALYFKKKGDTIAVTVKRKRFLLGEKELTVDVKL